MKDESSPDSVARPEDSRGRTTKFALRSNANNHKRNFRRMIYE